RVDRGGRREVDATAVRRPLPAADARLARRQLLGGSRLDPVDRETVKLLLATLPAPIDQPLPVGAEGEVHDALARVRDPARLATIGTHEVELLLVPVRGRSFTVRCEDEEAPVRRPPRRSLVLRRRERHLARRRHALPQRRQEDVRLAPRLLPVRERNRIKKPLAI